VADLDRPSRRTSLPFRWALLVACLACGSDPGPSPENTLARCSDGSDNDGDGFVDCDDQNCELFTRCLGGDSDSDSDTDAETDCATYCIHDTDCNGGSASECVDRCQCEAQFVYRADAAPDFFACLVGMSCSTTDPVGDCSDLVLSTIDPTAAAQDYLVACSDRRARACGRLPCEGHQLYTDAVLDTLLPCLDQGTCDAVLSCIDAIIGDAC